MKATLRPTLRLVFVVFLIGLLALAGALWLASRHHHDADADRKALHDKISRELPLGSSKSRVISFLNSNQMGLSEMGIDEYKHAYFPLEELPDSSQFVLVSITSKVSCSFFIVCQQQVFMGLDKDKALVGYKVKTVFTGP